MALCPAIHFPLGEIVGVDYLHPCGHNFVKPSFIAIAAGEFGNPQSAADIYAAAFLDRCEIGHPPALPGHDIVPCGFDYRFSVFVPIGIVGGDFEPCHAVLAEPVDFGVFSDISPKFDSVQSVIHNIGFNLRQINAGRRVQAG